MKVIFKKQGNEYIFRNYSIFKYGSTWLVHKNSMVIDSVRTLKSAKQVVIDDLPQNESGTLGESFTGENPHKSMKIENHK